MKNHKACLLAVALAVGGWVLTGEAWGIGVSPGLWEPTLTQGTDDIAQLGNGHVSMANPGDVLGIHLYFDKVWYQAYERVGFPYYVFDWDPEHPGTNVSNPRFPSDAQFFFDPNNRSESLTLYRADAERFDNAMALWEFSACTSSATLPPGAYTAELVIEQIVPPPEGDGAYFVPGVIVATCLDVTPNPAVAPTRWTIRNTTSGPIHDAFLMVDGHVWVHDGVISPGQSLSYVNTFLPSSRFSFAALWEDTENDTHPVFALSSNTEGVGFESIFPSCPLPENGIAGVKLAYGPLPSTFNDIVRQKWGLYGPAADPYSSRFAIPVGGGYSVGLYAFSNGQSVGEILVEQVPEPALLSLIGLGLGVAAFLRRRMHR